MDNDNKVNPTLNKVVSFLLLKSDNKEKQSANHLFLKLSLFLGTAIGAAKGMLDLSHHHINNIDSLESGLVLLATPILTATFSSVVSTYWYRTVTDFLDKKDKNKHQLLIEDNKILEKFVPIMKQMLYERNIKLDSSINFTLNEEDKKQLKDNFFEQFKTLALELKEKQNIKNMNHVIHKIFKDIVDEKELKEFDLNSEIKKVNHKM
jgi:hypothetical protein